MPWKVWKKRSNFVLESLENQSDFCTNPAKVTSLHCFALNKPLAVTCCSPGFGRRSDWEEKRQCCVSNTIQIMRNDTAFNTSYCKQQGLKCMHQVQVYYDTLLWRLQTSYGLGGNVIAWFASYRHDLKTFLLHSVYGHQDTDWLCDAPSVF